MNRVSTSAPSLTDHLQDWFGQNTKLKCLLLLLSFSLVTRYLVLGHPSSAVFDEVHFNYFSAFYYTGQYYYDIHPPLGKLLIALSAWPGGGIQPEDVVRTISTPFPNESYLSMRAVPAFAGSLIPVFIFLCAVELKLSNKAALLAGALALLDNAMIIQSRLILLDSMLLCFGIASLWFFLVSRRKKSLGLFVVAAVLAGCGMSVKWIGVSFLGLIGLIILVDWIKQWLARKWSITPFFYGTGLVAIALTVYTLTFAVHFHLLPVSHQQGDQFMSYDFRSGLEGSRYENAQAVATRVNCPSNYKHTITYGTPDTEIKSAEKLLCKIDYQAISAPGFWKKFSELNRVMYTTNQGLSQSHPDASPWFSWPIMHRPLYYWHHDNARIYLLGNPIVWWLSALAVMGFAIAQFKYRAWHQNEAAWIIQVGFWANMLPFSLVNRVMFMYHYLASLCFAILMIAFWLDQWKRPNKPMLALSITAVLGFILVSPLTYGANWFGSNMIWFLRLFGWHP